MRIMPLSTAYGRNLTPQKSNNVSFGLIDPSKREEILKRLPLNEDPDYARWEVEAMDFNKGTMVKLDGQRVYADLIMSHVNTSTQKDSYLEMTPEYYDNNREKELYRCLDHLENQKVFTKFTRNLFHINLYDGRPREPYVSSDSPREKTALELIGEEGR